jgi:hypothetical protein
VFARSEEADPANVKRKSQIEHAMLIDFKRKSRGTVCTVSRLVSQASAIHFLPFSSSLSVYLSKHLDEVSIASV